MSYIYTTFVKKIQEISGLVKTEQNNLAKSNKDLLVPESTAFLEKLVKYSRSSEYTNNNIFYRLVEKIGIYTPQPYYIESIINIIIMTNLDEQLKQIDLFLNGCAANLVCEQQYKELTDKLYQILINTISDPNLIYLRIYLALVDAIPSYPECCTFDMIKIMMPNVNKYYIGYDLVHKLFYHLCIKGETDLVKLMLTNHNIFTEADKSTSIAVFLACKFNHVDIVATLVAHGFSIDVIYKETKYIYFLGPVDIERCTTCLKCACDNKNIDIVGILLQHGGTNQITSYLLNLTIDIDINIFRVLATSSKMLKNDHVMKLFDKKYYLDALELMDTVDFDHWYFRHALDYTMNDPDIFKQVIEKYENKYGNKIDLCNALECTCEINNIDVFDCIVSSMQKYGLFHSGVSGHNLVTFICYNTSGNLYIFDKLYENCKTLGYEISRLCETEFVEMYGYENIKQILVKYGGIEDLLHLAVFQSDIDLINEILNTYNQFDGKILEIIIKYSPCLFSIWYEKYKSVSSHQDLIYIALCYKQLDIFTNLLKMEPMNNQTFRKCADRIDSHLSEYLDFHIILNKQNFTLSEKNLYKLLSNYVQYTDYQDISPNHFDIIFNYKGFTDDIVYKVLKYCLKTGRKTCAKYLIKRISPRYLIKKISQLIDSYKYSKIKALIKTSYDIPIIQNAIYYRLQQTNGDDLGSLTKYINSEFCDGCQLNNVNMV